MDLSKIENKLESGLYKSVEQFEADFTLMWDNCEEYNGDDSGQCHCCAPPSPPRKPSVVSFVRNFRTVLHVLTVIFHASKPCLFV